MDIVMMGQMIKDLRKNIKEAVISGLKESEFSNNKLSRCKTSLKTESVPFVSEVNLMFGCCVDVHLLSGMVITYSDDDLVKQIKSYDCKGA